MADTWHCEKTLSDEALLNGLASLDSCFELDGETVSRDKRSSVIRTVLGGKTLYIKRYTHEPTPILSNLGRSRIRAEWENLLLFHQLGINTPKVLAYGEERWFGQFRRGALVTEEVKGAQSLEQWAKKKHPVFQDKNLFQQTARQVADFVGRMHKVRFAHNDMDWRNILLIPSLDNNQSQSIFFIDCPSGRFWPSPLLTPFFNYRITKDLAHLDKLARRHIPLRWRLWFYHQYTGRKKLTPKDKKRLQKIANFYNEDRYRRRIRF